MKQAVSPATAVIIILVVVIVVAALGYALFLRKGAAPGADPDAEVVPDAPEQGMAMPGSDSEPDAAGDQPPMDEPMEMGGGSY